LQVSLNKLSRKKVLERVRAISIWYSLPEFDSLVEKISFGLKFKEENL
jgi:hypothetical protein